MYSQIHLEQNVMYQPDMNRKSPSAQIAALIRHVAKMLDIRPTEALYRVQQQITDD